MRKRVTTTFALTLGLLGSTLLPVLSTPARAYTQMVACSQNPNSPYGCRGAVYGVSATIYHVEADLSSFGGELVQSLYIYKDATETTPAYHVEFGWIQRRPGLAKNDRMLFVTWKDSCGGYHGPPYNSDGPGEWSIEHIQDGAITLQIYQLAGSIGTFRFRWKEGYAASTGWHYVSETVNPCGTWNSGWAMTAWEMEQAEDEPGLWFAHVQLENSSAAWVLATGSLGMEKWDDSEPSFNLYCKSNSTYGDNVYSSNSVGSSLCRDVFAP